MVDHSQDEDMVRTPCIENAERKSAQNGTADIGVNDRKGFRVGTDLNQCLIQITLDREVQT